MDAEDADEYDYPSDFSDVSSDGKPIPSEEDYEVRSQSAVTDSKDTIKMEDDVVEIFIPKPAANRSNL